MRFMVSIFWIVLSLIAANAATSYWNSYLGLAVFVAMVGWFITSALENEVPAQPKLMNGILTVFGKPTRIVHGPGRHFLPFGSSIFGYILVNATKTKKGTAIEVQTPDGVTNRFEEVSVEFKFDPEHHQEYLGSGMEDEIKDELENLITQSIRHWIESPDEGPQTWVEVKAARWGAANAVLESIMGNGLPSISNDIPSAILLKYFDRPRKPPNAVEKKEWGKRWRVLKQKIDDMAPQEQIEIEARTRERHSLITKIMEGSANLSKKEKGILITTITIGIIRPLGKVASLAESVTVAGIERKAAKEKLRQDKAQINARALEIKEMAVESGLEPAAAAEYIQVHRRETKKDISERTFKTSPDITAMLERLGTLLIGKLLPPAKRAKKARA
ncbi:MAG: SPFH domain-containing protein [Candidatus Liptonbacteria bacterium]|nr:SPFH domain-containing protein [Candidatus Liptonbacteria bacterium]